MSTLAFGSFAALDTGAWDIPKVGAAILHPGEMVLPAGAAEAFRSGTSGDNNIVVNLAPQINYRMTQAEWHGQADMMLRAINRKLQNFGKNPLSPAYT